MFGDTFSSATPIKYTSSCREGQRLSTEGKIVSKYCNISKSQGGGGGVGAAVDGTPSLYHSGGMTLRVRPRVKTNRKP